MTVSNRLGSLDPKREQTPAIEHGHHFPLASGGQSALRALAGPADRLKRKLRHESPHSTKSEFRNTKSKTNSKHEVSKQSQKKTSFSNSLALIFVLVSNFEFRVSSFSILLFAPR
jgi:hypothetical protein